MREIIITCALTGSIHTPSMSPHLPVTADEIAKAGVEAAEAGASILHLHARDPETGSPSADPDHFRAFLPRLKQGCDAVLNLSTGRQRGDEPRRAPCRPERGRAGNGLAQHGHDEFRALPDGRADHRLAA